MSTQIPLQEGISKTEDLASIMTEIDDKGVAILFSYIEDETCTVEASITDNFVETNHSVQDHIAIRPKIYRLRGCVGELVYKSSELFSRAIADKINSNPILKKTLNAMKPIAAISPIVSNYTQAAKNIVDQIESSYRRYKQMIEEGMLKKARATTNRMQQETVATLNRILELRQPVNLKGLKYGELILTEGDGYDRKYYIQSVSAHQGNNDFISDIEVTIKEFRIATTQVTNVDKSNVISIQKAVEQNIGTAKTQNVDITTNSEELKPGTKAIKNVFNTLDNKASWLSNGIQCVANRITALNLQMGVNILTGGWIRK